MKVYELTVKIIDLDEVGEPEIRYVLENAHYPNRCIAPEVLSAREADVGEWSDDHPLNRPDTADAERTRLFPKR
jgi:hypothetical protein